MLVMMIVVCLITLIQCSSCMCCLSRLLNFDADKWVHLNCALWSNEVYETMNGALMYVDSACKRGLSIECVICHKSGATAGCFRPRCPNVYHIACAQKDNVTFFEDKVSACFLCCSAIYSCVI